MSYERFNQAARNVMQTTQEEARTFNHEYVGTEHMLLAVVRDPDVRNVLAAHSIAPETVVRETTKLMQGGPPGGSSEKIPHTARTGKVIEYSIEEAWDMQHADVTPLHLLLGCIRMQEGLASQILANLGLMRIEHIRKTIMRYLAGLPLSPPKIERHGHGTVMTLGVASEGAGNPHELLLDAVNAKMKEGRTVMVILLEAMP